MFFFEYRITDVINDLYLKKTFSDVTFVIGNVKLRAHQNILGQRSPVFKKMFLKENALIEPQTVVLSDMPLEALKQLLMFIYTDQIAPLDSLDVFDVLELSKKYELPQLEEICVNHLKGYCNIFNVCRMMNKAMEKSQQTLITYFLKFISDYRDRFIYGTHPFNELSVNALSHILENGVLKTEPPKAVLSKMVDWMEANPQQKDHFPKLLKHIDLKSIELGKLAKMLQPLKAFDSNDLLDILCEQAKEPEGTVKIPCNVPTVTTVPESPKYASLSDQIKDLYLNPDFADGWFRFGEEWLPMHQNILVQRCPNFKPILTRTKGRIVVSKEVPVEAFKQFLKFIYRDEIELAQFDVPTLFIIWMISRDYCIKQVQKLCVDQLKSVCAIDNVGSIINNAVMHLQETLITYSLGYIRACSVEFVKHESFKKLSVKALEKILERKTLKLTSKEVFQHFVEWMKANPSEKKHFTKLLKHIDLTGMASTDMALALRPLNLIDGNDIMNIVREQADRSDKILLVKWQMLATLMCCLLFVLLIPFLINKTKRG